MRVLVIGSGGREHALVWRLRQSPRVDQVFSAPGNAGTAQEGDGVNVPIEPEFPTPVWPLIKPLLVSVPIVPELATAVVVLVITPELVIVNSSSMALFE